ncbi:SepM family pheromone-processing serine protease [Lacticaseibacillus baoqingensis]|uniref:SepM family pheromone-processing serine protease n=1 Tax=Lacticaseibacillus baoqingensis TaxID=2486013 RepID=A0ABW4E4T9_9LACO|nr:SepM family pheromone-processing serine protease [Lacticaseibacillus baoqingensis]
MRKRRWLAAIVLALGVGGFLFWPTGKYVEVPGSAESLKPYVKVAGTKDSAKGNYMLTTVGVIGPATPVELLYGKLQPYAEIDDASQLLGGDTSAEYDQLQRYYIKSAADMAKAAAFKAAKQPYQITHKGIYVMSILKGSPFKTQLKLGDTITQLDGKPYSTADQYVKAIQSRPIGSQLTLTYLRDGRQHQASGKLMRLPGTQKAGIGITLTEHTVTQTTPKVTIDAGNIGGPSAGLMFAVQVYTQITHQDLRHGQNIAGTGTIDADGNVGQIGGIDKKVYMANKQGAKVFFAPDTPATKQLLKLDPSYQNNYAVAKKTAHQLGSNMKIIPVKTLADALAYLQTH